MTIVIAKIAALLACAVVTAFLLGFAGRRWWLADLLAHFRVQYATLLWVCAVLLFLANWVSIAIVAAVAAAVVTATVVAYIKGSSAISATGTPVFQLISFNKYFRNPANRRIADYLEAIVADVIALQEVKNEESLETLVRELRSYPHRYVTSDPLQRVVVFSRWPITNAQTIKLAPDGVSVARVDVDWRGCPLTVLAVHLHWPMGVADSRLRNAELRGLASLTREISGPLLVTGDFNITAWSPNFGALISDSGLNDCARGRGLVTTWPAKFALLAMRIDQCLCSSHWQVVDLKRGPDLGSDHYAALTDLVLR